MTSGKKKLTQLFQSMAGTRKYCNNVSLFVVAVCLFVFTLPPQLPSLLYKKTSFQPSKPKMILWDTSPPFLVLAFQNEVSTNTFSNNLLLHLLACHVASSMSLNPVTPQVYFSYCVFPATTGLHTKSDF